MGKVYTIREQEKQAHKYIIGKENRPLRILEVIKIMFYFLPLFYISIYCPIAFQKKKSTISYQHGNMKYFTKHQQLMSLCLFLQNKITNESIVKIKDLFSLTFLRHQLLLLLNQKTCIFSDFQSYLFKVSEQIAKIIAKIFLPYIIPTEHSAYYSNIIND